MDSDKTSWMIKNAEGQIFGPASLETIKEWAAGGRIGPLDEISTDKQSWQGVRTLPELELHWVAEIEPGSFYGPVHRRALEELVQQGVVSDTAVLFKLTTIATDNQSQSLQQEVKQLTGELAKLEKKQKSSERKLEKQNQELEKQKQELEKQKWELAENKKNITELNKERKKLCKMLEDERTQTAVLNTTLQDMEIGQEKLRQELTERVGKLTTIAAEYAQVEQALQTVEAERDNLRQELDRQEQALKVVQRESARVGQLLQAAEERVESLSQAQTEQAALQASQYAVEWERRQQMLVRVSRELNRIVAELEEEGQIEPEHESGEGCETAEVLEAEPVEVQEGVFAAQGAAPFFSKCETHPQEKEEIPPVRGVAGNGSRMSMAELEKQAQRELQKLGKNAGAFFTRK